MKEKIQNVLDALSSGMIEKANRMCEEVIEESQKSFMESLTVNTATDYIGVLVLYCQITAKQKKPWLAVPKLEAARGALRFVDDFMIDRETVAATFSTVAESYAYAGFLPEAILYYRMAGCISSDAAVQENAFSQAFYYSILFDKDKKDKIDKDLVKASEDALGREVTKKILATAKEDASVQIQTDPIEHGEEFLAIRYEIEKEVDAALPCDSSDESFCLKYWRIKKQLLKEKFGIDWKTPAEMNPQIRFQ